jgi:methylenetetrahydrofolate dehydrogenase (NADP+)/methenyltetrahydrofolate cyclohydrolase
MKWIDGKACAESVRQRVAEQAKALQQKGVIPGLAVVLVGEDPASQVYVRMKGKACEQMGFYSITRKLPATISENELLKEIGALNIDPKIHGLLVQLPLPDHLFADYIIPYINPIKDVDCLHPLNTGKLLLGSGIFQPCTPRGILELLRWSGVDPEGKHVVIVGRSNIVGKPLSVMLSQKKPGANATVTLCHSRTRDLPGIISTGDIVIACIGQPEFVKGDWIKQGAVVIDVGVNRVEADNEKGYRLVGDVEAESAAKRASMMTPVPGGVGPMTIAMLLQNTLESAMRQYKITL